MAGPRPPNAEEIAWMLEHADDNRGPSFIACATIAAVIGTLCVALRLWSRHIQHGRMYLMASDWFAVAAWVSLMGYAVCGCLATRYGLGRHVIFITDHRLFSIMDLLFRFFYVPVVTFLKLSILCLYRNIFGTTRWFRCLIWVAAALAAELAIQSTFTIFLECIPLAHLWNPTLPARCINTSIVGSVAYAQNIITDVIILSMPIPLIRGLQISKQKKWGLIFAFTIGTSTCVVCLVQIKYFSGSSAIIVDGSWDRMYPNYLSTIECMTGFIATSVVVYGPLYRRLFQRPTTPSQGPLLED
ncbi:hypothetical protein F4813DRAFT_485 [Daldinia decipiens]|uniref:uncharacterized protein n=1 Tax=Daldinia decipiens TaxID=326647 RepID=UPI0020C48F9A|nr:uncharacterized protein F4813DRAFT_485 [Daldinia decipiens]KAI1662524.1 hypothetical protein F4813DRAFT_485 [Daldinia decipiens]